MKRHLLFVLLLMPTFVNGQDESQEFPPRKFDASRYEAIWIKNPFVAPLVPENKAREEEPEKWAEGLILKSVTRIGGKYVVHVEDQALAKEKDWTKRRARFQRLVEDANKPSIGGLRILQVKAHRDPSQVKVTVSNGEGADARRAVVTYDPKALKPTTKPTSSRKVTPSPTTTPRTTTPQTNRPTTQRRGRGGTAGGRGDGGGRGGTAGRGGGNRGGNAGTQGRQRGRTQTTSGTSSESTRRVVLPPGN